MKKFKPVSLLLPTGSTSTRLHHEFIIGSESVVRIVREIKDLYPNSKHVSDLHLSDKTDFHIWKFAKENQFCIVTFDSVFIDISALNGFPPKVIWIRTGNISTTNLVRALREKAVVIRDFLGDKENGFLELR